MKLGLVKDSEGDVWWVYDGIPHVLMAIVIGLFTLKFAPQYYLYVQLGVSVFFFLDEARQEYNMGEKNPLRKNRVVWYKPWTWSQNRHQDWGLPAIALHALRFI